MNYCKLYAMESGISIHCTDSFWRSAMMSFNSSSDGPNIRLFPLESRNPLVPSPRWAKAMWSLLRSLIGKRRSTKRTPNTQSQSQEGQI